MSPRIGIVILAAGLGTRMRSPMAKVLHPICGTPMVVYVVKTAMAVAGRNVVVVVGHQADQVRESVRGIGEIYFAQQDQQLGTGHAVMCALPRIPVEVEQVVVLCGDVPLIMPATIERLVADHGAHGRDVTLLAVSMENPTGYGRVLLNADGELTAIVEEADADEVQKGVKIINTGIYIIHRPFLETALPRLRSNNKQGEIYLTDIIGLGYEAGKSIGVLMGTDSDEIIGVNSRDDLQAVENLMKMRISGKDLDLL